MPSTSSGMSRLAEIAAAAVREHGADWPRIRIAIDAALAELPESERKALDIEIAANDRLISSTVDKLGH